MNLSSVYLENPRFTQISDQELSLISREAEFRFAAYFGYCIHIQTPARGSVSEAMALLTNQQRAQLLPDIVRTPTEENLQTLTALLADMIGDQEPQLSEQISYANSSGAVSVQKGASAEQLARVLVRHQAKTLKEYQRQLLSDGRPVIDQHPWNEYLYWNMLPKTALGYDLYFTNQPIISMEINSTSVHSAIRGGITNGNTTPCAHCDYGTASVVSLYAIFSNDPLVQKARTESAYSLAEKIAFAADLTDHELGHQLLQLGHPYGLASCVMDPVEGLNFRQRDLGLRSNSCEPGAAPSLQPGAAGFRNIPVPIH